MKEKIEQLKEFAGKFSSRTKKIAIAGLCLLVVASVVLAFVLNNQPYEVLFAGLGQEEAQQIVGKLQEDGVDFKYQGESTILVKKDILDETKAKLVQEGYPKSGFTYDTFINNAGLMSTDSDKRTYKLYELQDRISSTIRLFENVKDAKVTIALGEESKYALSDDEEQASSASAVVTMEDGGSPTEEQAAAIQRLIAKSIPDMKMEEVAVFDGNGNDVSSVDSEGGADSSNAEEIAGVIEEQVEKKVREVLGPVYGNQNVKISARAQVDMQRLLRETTTYNTPEKINPEDKTGIVSHEEGTTEKNKNTTGTTEGAAGAETNADTPEYATGENGGNASESEAESISKDYLVNQIKEQGEVAPGVLSDLTVSVAINGNGYGSLSEKQIRDLVGNAAGIDADEREGKISLVSAPFYEEQDEEKKAEEKERKTFNLLFIVLGVIAAVCLIVAIVIFVLQRRKKKKAAKMRAEMEALSLESAATAERLQREEQERINREMQEIQNDRGMELKRSIRDFAEQNPEISAQLLKSWLNGGDQNGE